MTNQNFTYSNTGNLEKIAFFSGEAYEKRATDVFFGLDYFPYGKILRSFYPNGERYLSTGHERDHETEVVGFQGTGLDNRGARLYDSDVARFLSLDPHATDYPSWSDYNYVLGNPVMFIDPDGKNAWKPGENGEWIAEAGDGAETLSRDAGISKNEAYEVMEKQGYGTYTDNGVTKSAVDPGDIIKLPFEKEVKDLTDPSKVNYFENKLEHLNTEMNQKVNILNEVTKDYEYYRKGPQGQTADQSIGHQVGYGINALRKEMQRNDLKNDTSEKGQLIRLYKDSLKLEQNK